MKEAILSIQIKHSSDTHMQGRNRRRSQKLIYSLTTSEDHLDSNLLAANQALSWRIMSLWEILSKQQMSKDQISQVKTWEREPWVVTKNVSVLELRVIMRMIPLLDSKSATSPYEAMGTWAVAVAWVASVTSWRWLITRLCRLVPWRVPKRSREVSLSSRPCSRCTLGQRDDLSTSHRTISQMP